MYKINEMSVKNEYGEEIKSYGVTYSGGEITDISTDRIKVENFIDTLNRMELSEIHIAEAVEDFLAEEMV